MPDSALTCANTTIPRGTSLLIDRTMISSQLSPPASIAPLSPMSNPGDAYYYPNSRTRRSPPSADASGSYFTGQGGRPVLPPIRSGFPTSPSPTSPPPVPAYGQDRTHTHHTASYEYNGGGFAPPSEWNGSAASGQAHAPHAGAYYDAHSRPASQAYYSQYAGRTGASAQYPAASVHQAVPAPREDARYGMNYPATGIPPSNYDIYNPSTTYAAAPYNYYSTAQSPSYSYASADPRSNPAAFMNQSYQAPARSVTSADRPARTSRSHASISPYARHPVPSSSTSSLHGAQGHAVEEEPVIKKKRKRADANQLKVLNETYNRTPFPSTEERQELARRLDMTARSVQIWFQNKRQSMRQGGRGSTATAATTTVPPRNSPSAFQAAPAPPPNAASIPRSLNSPPTMPATRSSMVPTPPYGMRHPTQDEVPHRPSSRLARSPPPPIPTQRRY